jgi:hypothetical protein
MRRAFSSTADAEYRVNRCDHRCRRGRVGSTLLLLLLLTILPLDCVAPRAGTLGDLQVQDTGYLTSFSIDDEYRLNTSSEATQTLSNFVRPAPRWTLCTARAGA